MDRRPLAFVPAYRLREWRLSICGFAMMAAVGLVQIAFTGGIVLLLYRIATWVVTGSFGFLDIGEWLHILGIAWDRNTAGMRAFLWIRHVPLSLFLILASLAIAMLAAGIFVYLFNRRAAKRL